MLARRGVENSAGLRAEFERGAPQARRPRRATPATLGRSPPPKSGANFWRHTQKAHPAPKSSTEHLACQRRRGIGTPIIPVGLGAEMRQGSALYVAKPLRCLPRGTSRHRRGLHGERYAHAHRYSHSIVAGGFVLMSYTTRFTPLTSLTMRVEILSSTSDGSLTQSHVIPSSLVTARITMGRS